MYRKQRYLAIPSDTRRAEAYIKKAVHMVRMKVLPGLHQVVTEGNLPSVLDWLNSSRWAEATVNVYCREGDEEIRANAVCGMAAVKDNINL